MWPRWSVWWFYLFWLPNFLNRTYHVGLANIGGSLIGVRGLCNWINQRTLDVGIVHQARLGGAEGSPTAMLVWAIAVTEIISVPEAVFRLWLTVTLVGIAARTVKQLESIENTGGI